MPPDLSYHASRNRDRYGVPVSKINYVDDNSFKMQIITPFLVNLCCIGTQSALKFSVVRHHENILVV